jgi:hypothetical protein
VAVAIRAIGTGTTGTTDTDGATGVIVSRPSGTTDGDELILVVQVTSSTGTIATPSGWSVLEAQFASQGSASAKMEAFRKTASSEASTTTVTWGSGKTGRAVGIMVALTGATAGVPHQSEAKRNNMASGTTCGTTALTCAVPSLALYFHGGYEGTSGQLVQWTADGSTSEQNQLCTRCTTKSEATLLLATESVTSLGSTSVRTANSDFTIQPTSIAILLNPSAKTCARDDTGTLSDVQTSQPKPALADTVSSSDNCSPVLTGGGLTKALDDAGSLTDARTVLDRKVAADTSTLADARVARLGRLLADMGTLVDALAAKPGKPLADSVTAGDANTLAVQPAKADEVAATDDHAASVITARNDAATTGDARVVSAKPALADAVNASDLRSSVTSFARTIEDAATLADDHTTSGGGAKALADTVSVGDDCTIVTVYARTVSDSLAVGDSPSRAASYGRVVSETLTPADLHSSLAVYARTVSDSVTGSDSARRLAHRTFAESLSAADITAKKSRKTLSDALGTADLQSSTVGLTIADALAVAEDAALGYEPWKEYRAGAGLFHTVVKTENAMPVGSMVEVDALTIASAYEQVSVGLIEVTLRLWRKRRW